MITVGANIRITRARCLEIIGEVREGTKELYENRLKNHVIYAFLSSS